MNMFAGNRSIHSWQLLPCVLLASALTLAAPSEQDQCHALLDSQNIPFDFTEHQWSTNPDALPVNAQVGEIRIQRFPIFNLDDPRESNWVFSSANYLHINTREHTLRVLLLFNTGDTFEPRLLEESARLLRDKTYLYDAKVFPFRVCGNRVDIMVLTRDVWTLTPGLNFSRAGGVNSRSFLLRENNFFGWGKRVTLARRDSVDREGWEFDYKDSNLFGSRLALDLLYAENDDGERQQIELSRPFYALDTRWSLGVAIDENERTDKLFLRGDSVAEFRTIDRHYNLSAGLSAGWHQGRTQRWWWGFSARQERFEVQPGEAPPAVFPADRDINYLWFGPQVIEDQFVTRHNFNQLYRTEDVNLGQRWQLKLGWADKAWGSDSDRLVYDYSYSNLWQLSEAQLLNVSVSLDGFWNQAQNNSEELQLSNRWRYYRVDSRRTASYASLELDYTRKLPSNKQLLLGGEENLRGYPLRYQAGDRRFLLTLEKRFYSDTHWYRIFRLGAAAFIDVGRAWFPGEDNRGSTGVLSNIGVGLRIASSRAEKTSVLHIDLAFPLQRQDDVDAVQIVLTGKDAF